MALKVIDTVHWIDSLLLFPTSDGVAPELTIDFDAQHVSKGEALVWWLGGIGFFVGLYQLVKWTDPASKNPAVDRSYNMVVPNPKIGPPEDPDA